MSTDHATASSSGNAVSTAIKALPAWKKAAAVLSLCVAVVGAGGATYAALAGGGAEKAVQAAGEKVPEGSETALVTGLAPTNGETTRTETDPQEEAEISALSEWSPAIFRMGFAFFVGFCIAYAMRTFMKITIVVLGVCLLLIIGLQQAGIDFVIEPYCRFQGTPGEQWTMFFLDPSGNALEFKAFEDLGQLFAV